MSSTNDQDATGRKRRKTGGGGDANREETGGALRAPSPPSISTSTPISSRLGTRLENAAPFLESQPTELQDLLIPLLKEMLSLASNIKQRVETIKKQSVPMVDPKTKQPIKMLKFPDQDLPFIPSSLRKACPIKSSDALKDDPRMQKLLDDAASDWEHFAKVKMAEHDRAVKQHEIRKRKEMLQEKFFDFTTTWAKGLMIDKRERGELPDDSTLSWSELALRLSYEAIAKYEEDSFSPLGYATNTSMLRGFTQRASYNAAVMESKASQADKDFSADRATSFKTMLEGTTVDIWRDEVQKDDGRKVNAAIRAELGPQQTAQATADVWNALDSSGNQGQEQRLLDLTRKAAREESSKQVQRILASQRKKSLGTAEIHVAAPTNNGRSSKQKSKRSTAQPKTKQSRKQPPQSSLKKGTKVKFSNSETQATSQTPARENRGGAKGRKQKGGSKRN